MQHIKVPKSPLNNFFLNIKTGLCAFILFLITIPVFAQQDLRAQEALAEKIYLQTDRNAYTIGETIWFKGIVTQAKDNVPSSLSGVLRVELIDPFETILGEKLVKLDNRIVLCIVNRSLNCDAFSGLINRFKTQKIIHPND